jgi:DNA-binding NarL/FixJ family response regulator
MGGPVRPRWKAIVLGRDPLLRFLVREALQTEGVGTFTDVAGPQQVSPQARLEGTRGVVVLCLNGPSDRWQRTIEETRQALPDGRLVAVTFGSPENLPGAFKTDGRLGADALVLGPPSAAALKEAVLNARVSRPQGQPRPGRPQGPPDRPGAGSPRTL